MTAATSSSSFTTNRIGPALPSTVILIRSLLPLRFWFFFCLLSNIIPSKRKRPKRDLSRLVNGSRAETVAGSLARSLARDLTGRGRGSGSTSPPWRIRTQRRDCSPSAGEGRATIHRRYCLRLPPFTTPLRWSDYLGSDQEWSWLITGRDQSQEPRAARIFTRKLWKREEISRSPREKREREGEENAVARGGGDDGGGGVGGVI